MSVSSWLTFTLAHAEPPIHVFSAMIKSGWNPNVYDKITYLPLSDGENFAWKSMPADRIEEAMKEMQQKGYEHESIGVVMTYRDTNCGGSFIFDEVGKLSFSLSVNRRKIMETGNVTAIEWYIKHIFSSLEKGGYTITSISWEESY